MLQTIATSIKGLGESFVFPESGPGGFEKLGVRYFHYLGRKYGTVTLRNLSIDELPDDITIQTIASNITHFAVLIAFGVGALTTLVTIWIETTYHHILTPYDFYFIYGSALIGMFLVEMLTLYWLGLKTVYSLSCLTGHYQINDDILLPLHHSLPNILARAALQAPDPVIKYLGIDPLKYLSKKKMIFVALLYKLKVKLSSLVVRYFLVRLTGKGASRTAFNWVAIPITGFWDAYTIFMVAREARLRLFGHKLADYLVTCVIRDDILTRLSLPAREGAVRAIASIMVLAQNYHPNMLILLVRFARSLEINEVKNYDDWDEFLILLNKLPEVERFFIYDLLSIAAAFDGKLSRLELLHLPEAFGEISDFYLNRTRELTEMLVAGRLHGAKKLCSLALGMD